MGWVSSIAEESKARSGKVSHMAADWTMSAPKPKGHGAISGEGETYSENANPDADTQFALKKKSELRLLTNTLFTIQAPRSIIVSPLIWASRPQGGNPEAFRRREHCCRLQYLESFFERKRLLMLIGNAFNSISLVHFL